MLTFKDSPYYDRALYKLAWSYYRDNRFPEAVREFDNLVKYADARTAAGQKVGSDLRPEAIQYLGVSFAEPDWDGDTLPDADHRPAARDGRSTRAARRSRTCARCSSASATSTSTRRSTQDAIAVYKTLLAKWPYYADAPRVQDRIVHAYEKDRNLVAAAKERESSGRNYTKGSDWYQHNKDNPDALAVAQQLAEDALLTAATNVHAAAQACKTKWLENQKDTKKLEECKKLYATSAELYEKFLAAYPNSKRSYEFSAFYADALYYSGPAAGGDRRLPDRARLAARQPVPGRRRLPDDQDVRRDHRRHEDGEGRSTTRRSPTRRTPSRRSSALAMPDIYKKYLEAIDWYVENIKNDRIPELQVRGRGHHAALPRLADARASAWPQITEQYCGTKSDVGFKAYDAILQTYFIDYSVEDEEQKDCALGKLLTVAEQFGESACGKAPQAQAVPGAHRADQVVGEDDDHHQAPAARRWRTRRRGRNKQLVMCRRGPGGIAMVTGVAAPSARPVARCQATKPASSSTRAGRRAGAGPDRRRQREPARTRARPPRSTTPASSTRSCSSSARPRSATSASTAATPTPSGARRRSGTPRATTTASSSSTRRSRAT